MTASRTISVKYTYNAWGELLSVTNASGITLSSATHIGNLNPLRYRGYYYDTETGFYYLQSRYYDPVMHRLINADSYASTDSNKAVAYNMFAYCENNPVIKADPRGEFGLLTLFIIGVTVGASVEYGSQVYDNYKEGKRGTQMLTEVNVGKIVSAGVSGGFGAIPGANCLSNAVDILVCPLVEEGVNCIVEDKKWNWKNVGMAATENTLNCWISPLFTSSTDVPKYIRDIKDEAIEWGIKGTNRLNRFLNFKQIDNIVCNTLISEQVSLDLS